MLGFFKKILASFFNLSFKKQTIIVISIVIIIAAIFYTQQYFSKRNGYLIEKAQKASITEIVTESGEIIANGQNIVYSPTNGNVEDIYVENGQQVKIGDQLFKVKSSATEQEKQTAYANYLAAKSAVDADNANLFSLQSSMYSTWKTYTDIATNSTFQNSDGSPNNSNRVLTNFTTAQADWLAAEAAFKNQQGVLAKDKAALTSANLAYLATQTSVVKAQIEGIIANISVSKGSSVHAQTLLNANPKPVLAITNNSNVEAAIPVGQTSIAKIKIGQNAVIRPDAYKDIEYKGTVTRIDSLGENNQGVVTYNVYITINNPDDKLKASMTLDGDIMTNQLDNVLSVPNAAVVLNEGKKSVRILKNNKVTYIPVLVGIKSDTRTQILKGISEGQEIIVSLTNEQLARSSLGTPP